MNKSHANDFYGTLTPGEESALDSYTSNGFLHINKFLRKGPGNMDPDLIEYHTERIERLDKAFTRPGAVLKENYTLHRGMDWEDFGEKVSRGEIGVGSTWTDKGFTSTSVRHDRIETGNVTMRIKAPKGLPAIHIDGHSAHPSEREVLLRRGTSFRITKIEQRLPGVSTDWILEVEAY